MVDMKMQDGFGKKLLVTGLAASMCLGLFGCGGQAANTTTAAAKAATSAAGTKAAASAGSTAARTAAKASAAATTAAAKKADLKGDIEMVTNGNEETYKAVNAVLQDFMKENPGVKITYTTQGSDYEQLMKARMASNDMPDIFATHGWSVKRYSEYLRPLNDQAWYKTIEASFMKNIANDQGQIFVLPINMDSSGILYNKGLLKELGVEVPKTWEQFLSICEKGKAKGYTGVFLAGKDNRQPASLLDISAQTFIANRSDKKYTDELVKGTFDWKNWAPLSQFLSDLKTKGYLNVDCTTCDPVDIPARMAENKVLFLVASDNSLIQRAAKINADAKYGLAPIPSLSESEKRVFAGGEREAYGIYKKTKHEDVCLAILNYLAKPENIKKVCEASGKPSPIKDVKPNLGTVMDDYTTYADIEVAPTFDRVYLPNGMWSTMRTIGSALIGGSMTVDESVKTMEADYKTMFSQK
jgi:raffinose/stachyose/melibiose transport system substrate-binding protein